MDRRPYPTHTYTNTNPTLSKSTITPDPILTPILSYATVPLLRYGRPIDPSDRRPENVAVDPAGGIGQVQALKRLPPYAGDYQPKTVSEEAYLSLLYQPGLTQPQRKIELRKRPPKKDDAFAAPAFDEEAKGEEGEGNEKQGISFPTFFSFN